MIRVIAFEIGNPANEAAAELWVNQPGTWEVEFAEEIRIPEGAEFMVMLCPSPNMGGTVGDDRTDPHGRSFYNSVHIGECLPWQPLPDMDLMIWSCVTPCEPVAVESVSWGAMKTACRR